MHLFVAAFCKGKDLKEISLPAFLTTTTNEDDIIMDGESVNYTCGDPSLLIPGDLDEDSNFVLEILCLNGKFETPEKHWPPSKCVANQTCTKFPDPPMYTNLVRKDAVSYTHLRAHET